MNRYRFTILDLGIKMESVFTGNTMEEAEQQCRETYAFELDCLPKDVEIIKMERV